MVGFARAFVDNGAANLAVIAIVVSGIAAGVSLISLAWNVVSWSWQGPRVRVRTHAHMVDGSQVVAAFVWNRGRSPVDIIHAEVHRDGWKHMPLVPLLEMNGSDLPFTLEPGKTVALETAFQPRGAYFGASWYSSRVELGNGDTKTSRKNRHPNRRFT